MRKLLLFLGLLSVLTGVALALVQLGEGQERALVVGDGSTVSPSSLTSLSTSAISSTVPKWTGSTGERASTATTSTTRPAPEVPPSTTSSASPATSTTKTTSPRVVIAWQPSHQDDTGAGGWHEYQICGDIAKRAIKLLEVSDVQSVLAWETGMGLTGSNNSGSNAPAFDSEIAQANKAGAHYFISIHNDGGAPSGVLGMFFEGDFRSSFYAERFAKAVAEGTGLPYRGIRSHYLYSLEQPRNQAPIRILLEIGDNEKDRAFLEDPGNRERIAQALAAVAGDLQLPAKG